MEYQIKIKGGLMLNYQELLNIAIEVRREWSLLNQLGLSFEDIHSAMEYCIRTQFKEKLSYNISFNIGISEDGYLKTRFRNDDYFCILSKTINLNDNLDIIDNLLFWFYKNVIGKNIDGDGYEIPF